MEEIFAAPEWMEALTFAERAALLGPGQGERPAPERLERAMRKAHRWRSEAELLDDKLFAERLALDNLTPDLFLRILAEPAEGWSRRMDGAAAWVQHLARVFSQPAPPLPAAFDGEGGLGVLELLRPLLADAFSQVEGALRRMEAAPGFACPQDVAAALLETLIRRLRWVCERVLALELQVSRLEGKLQGETPEARFASFVDGLRRPAGALAILRRYPVLARDVCRLASQWVETSLEMMERLAVDHGEVVRLLAGGKDPGPVVSVESGLSDRHAGGRSVAILSFASGLRIVYKPKPLAVDRCFQKLIVLLNAWGAEPPLRCPEVLDRGEYGWSEHVAAAACETEEQVERFYARQGAWVALFYVLNATDFHHENQIAAGEHPVPIDLETLFQPDRAQLAGSGPGYLPTAGTVLNSGLLPRRFWATAAEGGFDLSGMGTIGGRTVEVRKIQGDGTDDMRWTRGETRLPDSFNLPTLRGEPLVLWEHSEPVLRGFLSMIRLLRRRREELLAPGGPLAAFAGLRLRALLRATGSYAHLLHVANHPDYLQSALDRDRLYDRLWLDAVWYSPFRRAVRAEQEDLLAGDVPRFETLSTSTDLLHRGLRDARISGFFATPGMDVVRSRLRELDENDLERQRWLVEASLEATRSFDDVLVWPAPDPLDAADRGETGPAAPERFLAAAQRIGDRLVQLAIPQGELVTWFQLVPRPDGWFLEPMPTDLYSGLSGLALFLAHLSRLTGEERYERFARLALATIRQQIAGAPGEPAHLGAYSGRGGLVYTFTHLGLLWREAGLLDAAEDLARNLTGIEDDAHFDLIAGSAGALAALLTLYEHRPSPAVLAAAVRCGERLLAAAVVEEGRWGWLPSETLGQLPLTGFSHGTAGIAWALARLAQASGEERFRAAAWGALRYERSRFSAEHDNWPDLRAGRETADGREFLYAWCHGAPGIGLGRLATMPFLNDGEMPSEIRAAVRSTLKEGFGGNQSLCHGDLGNLELIREAGKALQDPELAAEADRLAARILARIESGGLRCGASPKTESLGLMTGLAGIGYGLLRAAWPERVPSVLLLETPGAQ
jgi:type 2 lantibiotic biosynthesis protein LanM